jgi:hypothetical protein
VLPLGNVRRPHEAPRALARALAGPGCLVFLWVYAGLHLAHERGLDLPVAHLVSPIPLFSTFLISLTVTAAASIAAALASRATRTRLYPSPRLLGWSIGVFAAVMVLFP